MSRDRERLIQGIVLGFVATAVAGGLLFLREKTDAPDRRVATAPPHATAILRLEASLAEESSARRELAEKIEALGNQISRLENRDRIDSDRNRDDRAQSHTGDSRGTSPEPEDDLETTGFNAARLAARGLHPTEVDRLRKAWVDYELTREEIADQALREGWFLRPRHQAELANLDQELRQDLSDEDFDRYLFALGKPNQLLAGEVLEGSTARDAGLRRGDRILRYDGVRVFTPGDLLLASASHGQDDQIPVEIFQDGGRQTVYVKGGPLGVMIEHESGTPFDESQ